MQNYDERWDVLIGNSFPWGLIKRPVEVEPMPLETLRALIRNGARIYSFWGHASTVQAASDLLGADLRPLETRPSIAVDQQGFPTFQGRTFHECWILAPIYREGVRPPVGAEVSPEDICSWNLLLIRWKT